MNSYFCGQIKNIKGHRPEGVGENDFRGKGLSWLGPGSLAFARPRLEFVNQGLRVKTGVWVLGFSYMGLQKVLKASEYGPQCQSDWQKFAALSFVCIL